MACNWVNFKRVAHVQESTFVTKQSCGSKEFAEILKERQSNTYS
jgi:hypothetical protein